MSVPKYLVALRPALDGSLSMVLAVNVLKWTIPAGWPLYIRFAMEVTGGAAAYLIVLAALHGDRLRSFVSLYRHRAASNTPTTIS